METMKCDFCGAIGPRDYAEKQWSTISKRPEYYARVVHHICSVECFIGLGERWGAEEKARLANVAAHNALHATTPSA